MNENKVMKRIVFIILLPLLVLAGCSREAKESAVSGLYRHYAERQDLKVAQVSGFKLSDTVRVDVVLMEADDEPAWQQLKQEFNIQGEEGAVSWLGETGDPAVRTQWTGAPVMRVIASLDNRTVGFYRIDNEAQYDAIVDYQLEKTKKRIQ